MNKQKTQFDSILSRIKNNPVLATILVLGTIVIALSTFTNAAKNLLSLIPNKSIPNVTGKWSTQILSNQFAEKDKFKLIFEFELLGRAIFGKIQKISTENRYNVAKGIRDVKITGNLISFYTQEESWVGDKTVHFKDFYRGEVSSKEIHFVLQSDRPWDFTPQNFVALKE